MLYTYGIQQNFEASFSILFVCFKIFLYSSCTSIFSLKEEIFYVIFIISVNYEIQASVQSLVPVGNILLVSVDVRLIADLAIHNLLGEQSAHWNLKIA